LLKGDNKSCKVPGVSNLRGKNENANKIVMNERSGSFKKYIDANVKSELSDVDANYGFLKNLSQNSPCMCD